MKLSTSTRCAKLEDIPILAMLEREVARVNFPVDPIEDLEYHEGKLRKALVKEPEGMVVLVASGSGEIMAWLWLTTRRTLATGEQYGVVRSIYVRSAARRAGLGSVLASYAQEYFQRKGIKRVAASVHSDNVAGLRMLSKAGFEAAHMTLEWRTAV